MTLAPRTPASSALAAVALVALAALPACDTTEVGPARTAIGTSPSPDDGQLYFMFPPTAATYDQYQAETTTREYVLYVDGKLLAGDLDDSQRAWLLANPCICPTGYLTSGTHHFELAPVDATSTILLSADGVIAAGMLNLLYVFGPSDDALQLRIISYEIPPPPDGHLHVHAINLARQSGLQIEIVRCTDAATCTAVSPPLALGDTYQADFPTADFVGSSTSSLSPSGAGLGYREVATPALPAPPVVSLDNAWAAQQPPPIWFASPVYFTPDGRPLMEFH